ncbi:hypothetical protein A4X13_0g1733 [Tilletia indica]|uniref:Association with the SNF1 complex (ASC) domain-containing protein n=1 Tax=Tilletia indica TaxID=43049 RepID=A0A177TFH4_9BASI|nr:hypothetical protein A4X13_0g1733 [Tilletia indica]
MGNTASTLQTPSDGSHGGERSRSPSVRRSLARGGGDTLSASASLSIAASSTLQQQERLAAAAAAASAAAAAAASASAGSGMRARASTHDPQRHSPQHHFAPLPALSHPHPQSHAYAFANQASLEPGVSPIHSHPFSNPTSPGSESPTEGVTPGGRPRSGSAGLALDAPAVDSPVGSPADDGRVAAAGGTTSRSRSIKTPTASNQQRAESPSSASRRSASVSSPVGQTRSGQGIAASAAASSDRAGGQAYNYHPPHGYHQHQPSPLRTEISHGSSRRRTTHEGLQLGMGFDPTTVVSSNPTTPLVATQNRHASGTPSHLEPPHPSTVFSALDVRTVENAPAGTSVPTLDRPKFQKRESGSGTPTQMNATDPFERTPVTTASQPLPLHRPGNNTETSFGIGDGAGESDITFSNGGYGLDVPRPIAKLGTSAVTDDDVPTPPELRKDALGRTLPAALPSYLRIPTTSMVDDENTLAFYDTPANSGGQGDLDSSVTADSSTDAARQSGQRKRASSGAYGPADNAVPFMAILLTWRGGGHNVSVTGTFANEWRSRIPLSRSETGSRKERGEFSCMLHLPPGTHRLKFLVDDRWKVSPDLSTATDGEGNLVNYVEIPNVGPDHPGPLSAPGEDLPDEGERGKGDDEGERGRADDDFAFPPAYLRASRLGKFGLVQLADPSGTGPPAYGLQTPMGGQEQELLEPPSQYSGHGKESSGATALEGRGSASLDDILASGDPSHDERAAAAAKAGDNRTSYYAESTTSSAGGSVGTAGPTHQQNTDLRITPMYARIDLDDDRPRASLDDVFGDDLKKKAEADSWTREIPEVIVQAQIAEELERERLEAAAASGAPQHSNHDHHHNQSSLPAPPSLPRQLEKVILNSGPAGLAGAVDDNSVLPAPNHVVLSHLTASSIKGGVLAVGTTTRYKRKYVTTVFHRPVR